ncbi:TIGR02680 family protein [Quadrisphaera sp. GCM10027208]|uniref:TIGR02680 family protein n=1 Tax=Quadrisphaera sp. GCM10027208 TaxID=3273423 RepID=UPI00360D1A0F
MSARTVTEQLTAEQVTAGPATNDQTTDHVTASAGRYRLSRAGVLNVWQYDDQVFELADGRMLLRGANGAGKSKTLEMLLPFAIDGDKMRITASGRHHTSLLWLMTDGHDGNRTGYLWVEFARTTPDGEREVLTCGVGVRASSTARTATSWYFTCPRSVGVDLFLEDDAGPLTRDRLRAEVSADGSFFDQARAYKAHVGRVLFGLDAARYDELLRLLYWLRQPQIGEDIEPARLADQLAQALPQLDDDAVRSAGDTFDELAAFGEQIERRGRAAEAVAAMAAIYRGYATARARERGAAFVEAHRELGRRRDAEARAAQDAQDRQRENDEVDFRLADTEQRLQRAQARTAELESSPEARSHQRVLDLAARAREAADVADTAQRTAEHARGRAQQVGERVAADARGLLEETASVAAAGLEVLGAASDAGLAQVPALPAGLREGPLTDRGTADALVDRLTEHATAVRSVLGPLGELLAAVAVVDDARKTAERADAEREAAERRAAETERRAEAERGRRQDAARLAADAEERLLTELATWRADARGVPVELPELTATTIAGLPAAVRAVAEPQTGQLRETEAAAAAAERAEDQLLAELAAERQAVEAERDPAPPAPPLGRTPRDDADGAPLWRLVDVVADLDDDRRAALEAALESSGLLDAWVRADGALLDPDRRDVVLPSGEPAAGRTLADVLVVDVPAGSPVTADLVTGVLRRVAVGDTDAAVSPGTATVALDGSWRLGPLIGRAAKPAAQYLGATARAAERERRLADVTARILAATGRRDDARRQRETARARRRDIESWLADLPSGQPLLTAWTRLEERTEAARRAEEEADTAERAAVAARTVAAERRAALVSLADRHRLPTSGQALAERRDLLVTLRTRVNRLVDAVPDLQRRLKRWGDDWELWRGDAEHADNLAEQAAQARMAAQSADEQHRTLADAVGAGIAELERRLAAARAETESARGELRVLRQDAGRLREQLGAARTALQAAAQRREEAEPLVVAAGRRLAELGDVPGLVGAVDVARDGHSPDGDSPDGGSPDGGSPDGAALSLAAGLQAGAPVPRPVLDLARRFAALPEPSRPVDAAALYAALQQATSSDAADHEPRVLPFGDLLAALGRDDGGEHPVTELATRLEAAIRRDRELLTERERTLFEEHLIGELGAVLRRRRLEAADLVEGMNRLLGQVTTSQGIAVRLRWQMREDVPEDARRAVDLLGRDVGALLPSERTELRDALHRLIEASRVEAPEESYTEHLSRALDYRQWFAFRIRYTRPEAPGTWLDLHRRSPLSQGEQKVVCYLPLFAAAAAHFTSLAGAAPHAPRFILLDDAFPKIDVRTHPLLFGLLVDLDLDFIVTSERLWGDHATVPSLAIYEALRDPGQRGIAQYRYTWDGARLQAVGA